jgi:capsular polysaccharide export protein
VLVPGQVEDDLSVQAGGHGLASNLELVRRVRLAEPDAEIWFRPHPDVDAGHRKGAVPDAAILAHADRVVRGGGMAPCSMRWMRCTCSPRWQGSRPCCAAGR